MIPVLIYLALAGPGAAGIADIDWEAVLAVAFGLGAIAVTWSEHKRTTKLDGTADELRERIATLEAAYAIGSEAMAERMATLESRLAEMRNDRFIEHAERLASIETRLRPAPVDASEDETSDGDE